LETRVLTWLDKLETSLKLWHETMLANSRRAAEKV
jgi:hypothetical protein